MYSCDGKAEFPALLQSSVSHDPSEIILKCWIGAQYFLMFYYLSNFPPSESENSWDKAVGYRIYQSLRDLTSGKNQFWQCVVFESLSMCVFVTDPLSLVALQVSQFFP